MYDVSVTLFMLGQALCHNFKNDRLLSLAMAGVELAPEQMAGKTSVQAIYGWVRRCQRRFASNWSAGLKIASGHPKEQGGRSRSCGTSGAEERRADNEERELQKERAITELSSGFLTGTCLWFIMLALHSGKLGSDNRVADIDMW